MAKIKLDQAEKEASAQKLKEYLDKELSIEIGGFDAQFLLDYFTEQVGYRFYNQGLADALKAFEGKLVECNELIYELEQDEPG